MPERFTESAHRVLRSAHDEALRLGHNFIGTEDVLVGLVVQKTTVSAIVLRAFGVDVEKVRQEVARSFPVMPELMELGKLLADSPLKKVINLAQQEARKLGHPRLSDEHLLLGILLLPDTAAAETLVQLGLKLDEVRARVLDGLTQNVSDNQSLIVIPARLASTRLPRKLLLAETGKPLIQHTYEAASRAKLARHVVVAADHSEIAEAVRGFGGQVEMTSPDCPSGTDRVAEVARRRPAFGILINVQGDEPEITGEAIDLLHKLLADDPEAEMATLATPIRTKEKLDDPACVKVVFGPDRKALYFSRSPIPHAREWDDALLSAEPACFHQHIGIYAYRREFLLELAELPPSRLEKLERLEQLRVLENGHRIAVGVIDEPTLGIDTPDDYRAFVEKVRGR